MKKKIIAVSLVMLLNTGLYASVAAETIHGTVSDGYNWTIDGDELTLNGIKSKWSLEIKDGNCYISGDKIESFDAESIDHDDEKYIFSEKNKPFMEWAMSHGYNDSLTLDRIDTNGNYEPSNCKWSTQTEQCNNRRSSVKFTFNGETLSISEWARKLHISRGTLWSRIKKHHMSIEQALTMPVGASRGKNHFEKLITFNGETLNQKEWAKRLGMFPTSLQRRLARMSVEEALTLPKKR